MPRKEFPIYLGTAGDLIRVIITTESGTVVDFVAQCEAPVEGKNHRIVRYDGSHGRGHRDLLNRDGTTREKRWMPEGSTLSEALDDGINELKANWEQYRAEFVRRRPS